ncbi:MAG: DUF4145 domain-containing protein [Spirulina sp. DLM2.Bin59]|nr:MAG: DUF4145 domain-containing protein [Spirulina sp. DLM2.Bin59]
MYTSPRASCFYARFTLEQAALWLYENDPYLKLPHDNGLGALIHEPTFKENLKPGLFPKIRLIQKQGNHAVHQEREVKAVDALRLVEELFHFLYWLCRAYGANRKSLGDLSFDRTLIPKTSQDPQLSKADLQKLEAERAQADALRRIAEDRQRKTEAELAAAHAELAAIRQKNEQIPDRHDYNEAETRHYLIDHLLAEAGWHLKNPQSIRTEVEVTGMPNASGGGRVDYVLWGDNGKPLALIEAKRTSSSPDKGKHQAKLYADCLETEYQQRPVIFYTNGYETWLWDDRQYPPRQVQGFLKKDELDRLIFRRHHRKPLHGLPLEDAIAGRTYQKEAIRRLTEGFEEQRNRKALLVMATGTGKTRTAIALVELLKRANWVQRVLFLADRTALLTQAYRAFQRYLPTVTPLNLLESKSIEGANVILSTYTTMLNALDRTVGDQRVFGVGYFDLVIVDEAHRSIYQKYGALFDYFDSLLVGLTATPRSELDRDTYGVFDLQQGVPTFAYELNDAVKDGYLVPPQGVNVPFKFLRTGLKYQDLSPDEQQEYEEKFLDDETGELPTIINAGALNKWLFNINTVDQALEILMARGLKVEGGDRLGKTIIFARNHKHAAFIVERFDHNYPKDRGHFAQIIDSHNAYAQSLLDDFATADQDPMIAVSVDMLDTGVDVPEVVNLVFFKPVFSRVKFNQMIGRGTRLCPDLFGLGQDKTAFLVFDLCGNFDYFEQTLKETAAKIPQSLTTRLVKHRLELVTLLSTPEPEQPSTVRAAEKPAAYVVDDSPANLQDTAPPRLRERLLDLLHQHVATMPPDNFLIRRHWQQVEAFRERDRWNQLSEGDREMIAAILAPLPNGLPREDALAKQFDLLCLKLQLAILKAAASYERLRDQVRDTLSQLEEKPDIPMIKPHLALIQAAQVEAWWTEITVAAVEDLRLKIRELVKFIDRQNQAPIYTDFADELGEIQDVTVPTQQTGFSPYQYRKKVEAYIRAQQDHVAIAKLRRNLPLTAMDLNTLEEMLFSAQALESRDRFEQVFGTEKSLKRLIRELVGLDRNAAKQAFGRYLEGSTFNATQIRFVETIIDLLTQNGIMNPGLLYEPPFTDSHPEGLDGVFADTDADKIVAIIRTFNQGADVDFNTAAAS